MGHTSNSDDNTARPTVSLRTHVGDLVTIDLEEIRQWAEQRGGLPSIVPADRGRRAGAIRIDFPDGPERHLKHIGWDAWFQSFDENHLAFLYQERTATGKLSRFHRLVRRESLEGRRRTVEAAPRVRTAGARQAA